jgi:hypothetical protein
MKSPKLGVIFFHSNIRFLYSDVWIEKSFRSMIDQTIGDFTIYEINYGGDTYTIFDGLDIQQDKKFYSQKLENHAEAMNFIIDQAFEDGCEYVFNTNLDDFYSLNRIEKQLGFLNQGYDIVSSDFCYIKEIEGSDVVTRFLKIKKHGDIKSNLERKNNIIAHPCVAYSKKFWESNRYNPEEIPEEDMLLWRRGIESGFKFHICDEVLLNYRLHSNQVTGDNSISSPENTNKPITPSNSSQVNSVGPTTLV